MGSFDLKRALVGAGLGTLAMPGAGTVIGALVGGLTSTPVDGQQQEQNPVDILVPPDPTPGGQHAPPPPSSDQMPGELSTGIKTGTGILLTSLGAPAATVAIAAAAVAIVSSIFWDMLTGVGSNWGPAGPPPIWWPINSDFDAWLHRQGFIGPAQLQQNLVALASQRFYNNLDLIRGGGCVQSGASTDIILGSDSQPLPICVIVPNDVIELIPYPPYDPPPPPDSRYAYNSDMLTWLRRAGKSPSNYTRELNGLLRDVIMQSLNSYVSEG